MTSAPILVGVDGSGCSLVAVDLAVLEAALRGLPLRIVYCDPGPTTPPGRTTTHRRATFRPPRDRLSGRPPTGRPPARCR
ncbi:universal stress protein [Actinoplanes sp. NPDC051346]|uniref:universal stress protein n=1 Tax=Actinoplanes sp. NPDC051346 TaxID=3155048 RepID=UPI00342BF304